MNAPHAIHIVEGYVARLEVALAHLDRGRRDELLADIRAHVAEARAGLAEETDADLFAILDRLGEPADVAAGLEDARDAAADPPGPINAPNGGARWGVLEASALLLTFFVWPAGLVLAWLSRAWDRREKLVATSIGGVAFLIGFPVFAPLVAPLLGPLVASLGTAAPLLIGTIGALPLASAVYLAARLSRRGASFALV